MKQALRRFLDYRPLDETRPVRKALAPLRDRGDLPVCPPWEGDLIHETLTSLGATACLEIGFHTGSTALYMLHALRAAGGTVVSVEPNPDGVAGFGTVAAFDAGAARHETVGAPSHAALPRLLAEGRRFDFVFLDGWKTFDALVLDAYYATRLLNTGGVLFFDDHHMPSVRRTVRLMRTHYGYASMPAVPAHAGARFRLFLALTGRSRHMPFVRLRKALDDADAPAVTDWNFYARI